MKVVPASFEIITPGPHDGPHMLAQIERVARDCYKSGDKITATSYEKFVKMLMDRGHHAMIEFGGDIIVRFVCDRGISHELVRHRLCSFAQQSTRYVDSSRTGMEVILPPGLTEGDSYDIWKAAMLDAEAAYSGLRTWVKPEIARSVLPTCLATVINVKGNPREWRHIFSMRTPITAHPQMRHLVRPLLAEMKHRIPILFDDIEVVD